MINVNSSVASAFASGRLGLQQATDGLTRASVSIAQRSAENSLQRLEPQEVLQQAVYRSLENMRSILPQSSGNATSDLVSLQLNSRNAIASAKVLDVADETVGRIINTLA